MTETTLNPRSTSSTPTTPPVTDPAAAAHRQLAAHPSVPTLPVSHVHFDLPPALEASEPPEARGTGRDDVRLLVSVGTEEPVHARFVDLPDLLEPDDLLVVNTSATMAASLDAIDPTGRALEVHLSTRLPSGLWLVEVRQPDERATRPDFRDHHDVTLGLGGGASVRILARYRGSHRLWLAVFDTASLTLDQLLARYGRPIRYGHVPRDWPLDAYQTVFGQFPGSAEMPSASRPFTPAVVDAADGQGHRAGPHRAAHRGVLAGGQRAALPRVVRGAGGHAPSGSTPPVGPGGGWWPSAPPWCGPSRAPGARTGWPTPGRGGPTWW